MSRKCNLRSFQEINKADLNIIHPVQILKIRPYCRCIFTLLTTSVDNKVLIIVILFHFFMN